MDLALSSEQELLRETSRRFVERETTIANLLAWQDEPLGAPADVWKKMCGQGWLEMAGPATGGSLLDAAVVFEELGRAPLDTPALGSGVVAGSILASGRSQAEGHEVVRRIDDLSSRVASGEAIAALAVTEPEGGWGPSAIRLQAKEQDGGWVVDGTKLFVKDGEAASTFIVVCRTGQGVDDLALFLIDAGATGVVVARMNGFLGRCAAVTFQAHRVEPADVICTTGAWDIVEKSLLRAVPLLCAYQVGGCQALFERSAEYTRTRRQFGMPIGRFQHVQAHMVRMVNALDAARWATYEAIARIDGAKPASASVHMAKAVASESYVKVCDASHEVHAGIGSDPQYGITLHTEQARGLYSHLGSPMWHKRKMADALEL